LLDQDGQWIRRTQNSKSTLLCWHLLRDSIAVPVIAGLAVGMAFILLMSFYTYITTSFRDTLTGVTITGDLTITLAGVKDEYALNEPLNFTVNYKGDGFWCRGPTARVLDANSGEIAYDNPRQYNFAITCIDEQPREYIDITWTFNDVVLSDTPVLIGKPGHYRVEVKGGGVLLEKDFIINDNLLSP
jgi:hypothetical protein